MKKCANNIETYKKHTRKYYEMCQNIFETFENTTYLIDENLNIAHTWTMSTECNYTVLLKDNGNLVRGTKNNTQTGGTNNSLNGAASSGRVQEIDPLGNIVMDFIYSSNDIFID